MEASLKSTVRVLGWLLVALGVTSYACMRCRAFKANQSRRDLRTDLSRWEDEGGNASVS
jgi:hypothetical protein